MLIMLQFLHLYTRIVGETERDYSDACTYVYEDEEQLGRVGDMEIHVDANETEQQGTIERRPTEIHAYEKEHSGIVGD